jgi:hypothetical protein
MKKLIMAILLCGLVSHVLANPYAYPVPYVEKDQPTKKIYFKDLPLDGSIKIYTIDGDLVKEIEFENYPSEIPFWNVTNTAGKTVASGVYLFEVESGDESSVGKLVVIR